MNSTRLTTRLHVIQALYQMDMTAIPLEQLLREFHPFSPENEDDEEENGGGEGGHRDAEKINKGDTGGSADDENIRGDAYAEKIGAAVARVQAQAWARSDTGGIASSSPETPLQHTLDDHKDKTKNIAADTTSVPAADQEQFHNLLCGVVQNLDAIDAKLQSSLDHGWRAERMDRTLRATLRAGLYEILFPSPTPAQTIATAQSVTIKTYHKIAASFFPPTQTSLVRAILQNATQNSPPSSISPTPES